MDQRQRLKRKRMIRQKKMAGNAEYAYFDYGLVAVLIFLICFGLIMLYSTSYYSAQIDYKGDGAFYFRRQLLFSGGSLLVMYVVTKVDYHRYTRYATILYVVSFSLMALVQTPLGVEVNGARRWLRFPVIQRFQPSEITKIAMILFIPYLICKFGKKGGASDSPVWNTCGGRGIRADGKLKYSDHCIWNFGCYFFCGLSTDKKDRNCFCLPCGWRTNCGTDSGKAFGVQRELPFTENPLLGGPGKIRQKRSFPDNAGTSGNRKRRIFRKGTGRQRSEDGDPGAAE